VTAEPLRVGVVGGGLIAQAVHLPHLAADREHFAIVGIADPSPKVVEALAARYAPARGYLSWRELLEREELDAVAVCSPHSTHAEVVLAALDSGLHAFVEKPLCITVEDAERIADRARTTGLVVQVGYMKRHSDAYAAFLEALPAADGLRVVDVVTYDPWMAREPFVPWREMVQGDDVPAAVRTAGAADEARQVEQAVGRGDPETVRSFSYTFLACLVHDVNLVHGALDALGLDAPVEAVASSAWAGGDAAAGTLRLPGGGVWQISWALLRRLMHFEERVTLLFDDGVHELRFPMPYDAALPVGHRVVDTTNGAHRDRTTKHLTDSYEAELAAFHACIRGGGLNLTPPEQSVRDLELLRDLFLATGSPA
jgi:predicted dehydrogenase